MTKTFFFFLNIYHEEFKPQVLLNCRSHVKSKRNDKDAAIIFEPFPELYFWICTQGIKVQHKIQNNV